MFSMDIAGNEAWRQFMDRHVFNSGGFRIACNSCRQSCHGNEGMSRCDCCNMMFGMGEIILGKKVN